MQDLDLSVTAHGGQEGPTVRRGADVQWEACLLVDAVGLTAQPRGSQTIPEQVLKNCPGAREVPRTELATEA